MASIRRPWAFGSEPPTGSGRARGSLHVGPSFLAFASTCSASSFLFCFVFFFLWPLDLARMDHVIIV